MNPEEATLANSIRIRGLVQGVGFRPFVWHLATGLGIKGSVCNDAEGVLIHAWGDAVTLQHFQRQMSEQPPPLARIDAIESQDLESAAAPETFSIVESHHTGRKAASVTPDAAICPHCLSDIRDPQSRHHGYPFTSCTHCGPRLSIVRKVPYDRANTSMAGFVMCPQCRAEYDDPADRRFHAQANACPQCGPRIWLQDASGQHTGDKDSADTIIRAASLLREGHILAIKGIGGVHLAVDAGNDAAVAKLRARKQRDVKPFALMAADIGSVRRFASVDAAEAQLLDSTAAPIVLLDRRHDGEHLADSIAPSQSRLGFMLPYSPLHSLLMQQIQTPIVLTSGNLSDEPQCVDNADAIKRLSGIADYFLLHDRDIVNRLDDSVASVMAGTPRLLRRARGYAPAPLLLHESLAGTPRLLAMGSEMKNTFCQLDCAKAIISQHLGDLEQSATHHDYRKALDLYAQMYDFTPEAIAVDMHQDYASSRIGQKMAEASGVRLITVQHHHAHVAAVLAEHRMALDSARVLGIALDGLGLGDDGTIWGGEFLLADYTHSTRVGCFQPVPMPGAAQAIREPWRSAFAHLRAGGQDMLQSMPNDSDISRFLATKPTVLLQSMIDKGLNSPFTSSCGRLFDAVAAVLGICHERIHYEGQAAIELECLARGAYSHALEAFPWHIGTAANGILQINWQPMWHALLGDIAAGTGYAMIAARFHKTLSAAVCELAARLCHTHAIGSVVLCGGSFQNRLLLESTEMDLRNRGLTVLMARQLPMGDGGLSLGQAAVAAARIIKGYSND